MLELVTRTSTVFCETLAGADIAINSELDRIYENNDNVIVDDIRELHGNWMLIRYRCLSHTA